MQDAKKMNQSPEMTQEAFVQEIIEASRMIETLASRAAEHLESIFYAYSKDLRKRAQAHLAAQETTDED